MDICYLANIRLPTGKAHGIAVMHACAAFAEAGAEVELAVPRRRTSSDSVFEQYGIERNFRIVFLPTLDLFGRIPYVLAFPLQALTFYASAKFRLLFGSRARIIYTRDILPLFFAWLGYRVAYECHRIPRYRRFFFFAARRARRIVAISQALKDAFVRKGFRADDILVAPSGVDLAVFDIPIDKDEARRKLGLPEHDYLAVYTGNFTTMGEDKGIADILRALPDAPSVMFLAVGGSGPDIAHYLARAKEAGVEERVMLLGRKTQAELAVYQKAADVLLMPFPDTPHYRNYMSPVKMFEYMAAERPIVASDLPTIREVLDESCAVFVPPGAPGAIAEALKGLAAHPESEKQLAATVHAKAQAYTWRARARRVLAFIEP